MLIKACLFVCLCSLLGSSLLPAAQPPEIRPLSAAATEVQPAAPARSSPPYQLDPLPPGPDPRQAEVPRLRIIGDPIEMLNRSFHGFNNVFSFIFLEPFEKGYRFVFPTPVRKSIRKAGYNLLFPNRLVNNLLEGHPVRAGVETERFLVNTTVGLLGFFDPATHWGIKKYDADFGKTFAGYGLGFGGYFEAPIFGPNSIRDAVVSPLDGVFDPAGYVFGDYFFELNDLSFTLPRFERIDDMEQDPYVADRDYWALDRDRFVKGVGVETSSSTPLHRSEPVPTIKAVLFRPHDPKFQDRGKEREARIPATGRKLPYTVWMQPHPAPLVFIVPGVGVHRLADAVTGLAELAWRQGASAVAMDNPMNWEFIENAGSRDVPGYTPVDAADLKAAMQAVDADLSAKYPGRITATALVGASLGALDALFVAAADPAGKNQGFHLDRIVAVNPPVDLVYAMQQVDGYYLAPLEWPRAEREKRMRMALLKAAQQLNPDVSHPTGQPYTGQPLPFDATESKFLIGFYYRWILRDIIFASQRKHDLGVIPGAHYGGMHRQKTYDAIMRYSYTDFVRQFVLPDYEGSRGLGLPQAELLRRASLPSIADRLAADSRVRVFANQDDFLLSPQDIAWLRATFGDRLTVFPSGGHLGNLHQENVQQAISAALEGLK